MAAEGDLQVANPQPTPAGSLRLGPRIETTAAIDHRQLHELGVSSHRDAAQAPRELRPRS
jgi:hypothetical protein